MKKTGSKMSNSSCIQCQVEDFILAEGSCFLKKHYNSMAWLAAEWMFQNATNECLINLFASLLTKRKYNIFSFKSSFTLGHT